MEDVKHPRLAKRGTRYWFRAKIPSDLVEHFHPKRERVFSLGTAEPRQALEKVRVASVRFDQEMAEARRQLAAVPLACISDAEVERLTAIWLADVLEEDEETRREGLGGGKVFADVRHRRGGAAGDDQVSFGFLRKRLPVIVSSQHPHGTVAGFRARYLGGSTPTPFS